MDREGTTTTTTTSSSSSTTTTHHSSTASLSSAATPSRSEYSPSPPESSSRYLPVHFLPRSCRPSIRAMLCRPGYHCWHDDPPRQGLTHPKQSTAYLTGPRTRKPAFYSARSTVAWLATLLSMLLLCRQSSFLWTAASIFGGLEVATRACSQPLPS
ncbi:hypothetical protein BDW74DRAFT_53544 [Aspergillus multicolor]|uniref:uncharacterized protein n=1 Tax=Aspergillus multicolor TaxID=41759 RepID=UPI003CCD0E9D